MIEMDIERVAYVGGVLRAEHADMANAESELIEAERRSAEPELLVAIRSPLYEFLDETLLLADLLDATRELMLSHDRFDFAGAVDQQADVNAALAALVGALNDGEGATGSLAEMFAYGDAELAAAETGAETVLAWMVDEDADGFSFDDFADLVDDDDVPQEVRDAIAAITGEPVIMQNLVRASWLTGSTDGVSTESIELLVATQRVSRDLGRRATFDQFDSASTKASTARPAPSAS